MSPRDALTDLLVGWGGDTDPPWALAMRPPEFKPDVQLTSLILNFTQDLYAV